MKYSAFKINLSILLIVGIIFPLFTTCEKPERVVKLETLEIELEDVTYTTATLRGEITDIGSKPIEQHGLLISESSFPNLGQTNTTEHPMGSAKTKGIFSYQFTGLKKNTTYYFRAFVVVSSVPQFGEIKQFKTKDTEVATVTAGTISNLTLTTATLNGEVTSDGGEPVTKRGLCWGTSAGPTLTSCLDTTINGSGTGTFTGLMHGLTAGTTYYARSYAINTKGTSYNAADVVFTTQNLPVATTIAANPVQNTTATLNGTVNANNLSSVVTFEYGTTTAYGQTATASQSPVTGNTATNVSALLTGLNPGTLYHFRVKAVSSAGTSIGGSDMTFTTLEPPVATTSPATPITNTTATLNGTVNAKNSSTTVTFEYGETTAYGQNVTATPATVTGNSGTPVSANITGLTQGTEYHFRVKASSAGGQSDGLDQTFTTLQPPIAVTGAADNVTSSGATFHGTINAKNSSTTVTFEYGETTSYGTTVTATQSPVTGNSVTNVSATVSGLNPSTTYHFRVKGNSAGGTGAGSDATFITLTPPPIVTDFDGNVYNTVQIGTQIWMKENLMTTKASDGSTLEVAWFYGDNLPNLSVYGRLYRWFEASAIGNICPVGWHVPLKSEWVLLSDNLGGLSVAGGKMKETGTSHWVDPNTGATNESGFTALPGGDRYMTGAYGVLGYHCYFWSLDEFVSSLQNVQESLSITPDPFDRNFGASIRCVKGEMPLVSTDLATSISNSTSTLNGKVNPNGASTTVTFEYGTTTSYGMEVAASQSPVSGSVPVIVSADLIALTTESTYHYRVKAVNSGGTTYGRDRVFATLPLVADIDGNVYNTVTIGSQTWMKENLKATTYNDGTIIPYITLDATWNVPGGGAYCDYNHNPVYGNIFGRLYNFYAAADIRKLCPTDWHVATDADWTTLTVNLGGTDIAGGKMKEAGISHWTDPNVSATNESGFTALPGGYRDVGGTFQYISSYAYWWSSTPDVGGFSFSMGLWSGDGKTIRGRDWGTYGFSVRCIKD